MTRIMRRASLHKKVKKRVLFNEAGARSSACVNITLLNDSERLLNKKWLCPVISKSNTSIGWKAK